MKHLLAGAKFAGAENAGSGAAYFSPGHF